MLRTLIAPKVGSYHFPLISLAMRIIDNPSKVKANPMLKSDVPTILPNISKTPIKITITFKAIILDKIGFILIMRIINNASKARANTKLKAGNATRLLSIVKR